MNSSSSSSSSSSSMYQSTVPEYINKYPQLRQSIPRIHQMLRQLPSASDRPSEQEGHFEIEARFGTISNDGRNTFQSGVSKDFMDKCIATVSSFEDWKQITEWEPTHDYYYELPPHPEDLRGQGILVRTTSVFVAPQTTGGTESQIVTNHTCKVVRDKYDFRYITGPMNISTVPGHDVRVSLNFEEKVPVDSIPSRVEPKFVRIKNRKSFIYQPQNCSVPIWSMDFTCSWSAANRSDAEQKQKKGQTVYEIEVECLDPFVYMSSTKRDEYYLATSLMLKMRDFVGTNTRFDWEPVYKHGY